MTTSPDRGSAELAPRYDPSTIERRIYQRWIDAGVFTASSDSDRTPYVIVIPPPNVTAILHMGQGLNNTLQDLLIRFERMRGRETLWLPGPEHAGIATLNVVERLLEQEDQTRHDLGRAAFVERVWGYVKKTGDEILDQLKAIGSSCDWSRTRFTLDDGYTAAVRQVFVTLHDEGLIYRGHRVIHWCPRCLTSLSDEEAEFREKDDSLYYLRYRLVDGGDGAEGTEGGYVVVATTRPETMFGDVALVFHPEDERYTQLRGELVEIPLSGVRIPIDASERVEREFGTAMLKVTPAHDANDFEIAGELAGEYDRPVIMDEHGRMAEVERVPAGLQGLDRDYARKYILELLRGEGLLEKVEPLRHAVRHCYRCHTIIEPRLSDQWFVRMQPLAQPALEAYRAGALRFVPDRWGKVYENWLSGIRDWNISRQLWWGHRIPAWYCEAEGCEHITVVLEAPSACEACGGAVRQDEDVLDTWFSSWLWPFATMGWPEKTRDLERFYPGHTLVTAPDIIFFWVARMVMACYHFMDAAPFDTVYMNGIVRDTQHRKMSKSAGNGIDPIEVVRLFGADALRYTVVVGSALGTDVILDPQELGASFAPGRNFANKVWNVGRLVLPRFGGTTGSVESIDAARLEIADRWILSRCQHAIRATTDALERFRASDAAEIVYHFIWDELADWYLEQVKPRLYGKAEGGDVARSVLAEVLATALKLLHPVMPFITEELWSHLPGQRGLIAASAWPTPRDEMVDEAIEREFEHVQALVGAVRTVRAEYGVPPGKAVSAVVDAASPEARQAFESELQIIERLGKVDSVTFDGDTSGVGAHAVLSDGSSVFIPLGDTIDVERECARLTKELKRLDGYLTGVGEKLANEQFTSRAPSEVVEREREKERSWREQHDTLAVKLRSLGC